MGFSACADAGAGCGGRRGGGQTPYVRCLAAEPDEVDATVSGVTLHGDARSLAISGIDRPSTVAAFAGPAPAARLSAAAIATVRAANPSLTFVLGGLGSAAADIQHNVRALSTLPGAVLVLAGGRDRGASLRAAISGLSDEQAERIVDITPFEAVRVGPDTFVPIAGAADGRYAIDADGCGFGLSDLKQRATALGAPKAGERRWLVSWQAPGAGGPFGVARDAEGVDTGNVDLGELAKRIGAPGGLFAWPAVQAGRAARQAGHQRLSEGELSADVRLVVPRLGGPALVRADGSRQPPGIALFSLEQGGLRFVGIAGEQPKASGG